MTRPTVPDPSGPRKSGPKKSGPKKSGHRAPELRRARAAVAAGFGLQGLVFAAIVTQVPRLQDRFDLGEGDVTVLLVVVATVSGVGSVLAGMVAERSTSATAFRIALLAIAVGALLVGLAPNRALLTAAFVVYGLGIGAVDAGMNMQGVRVQAAYGQSVMAGFHGMWSVGGIVGALYASAVAGLDVSLALSLVVVAAVTVAVVAVAGRHFVAAQEQEVDLTGRGLAVPWRPVLVFGLVVLVFYASDTGTLTWSSVYLDDALDASDQVVPLGYAAYQAGALVSRFGGDHLVRRRGAAPVVRWGTVLGVAGLALVVVAGQPWLAIIAFFVVGLGLAVLAPLAFAGLAGVVRGPALDVAIARMNIANYLGAILGGGLIGAAASSGHLRWAFVIPLVIVPVVLVTVHAFRSAETRRPAP